MYSPQLPVGVPTTTYRPTAASVPVAAPQAAAQPMPAPVQGQSVGIMAVISNIVTGIIDFFKRLFSRSNTGPTTPGTASTLTPEDAAIAKQYGLRADAENVKNFKTMLATIKAEPGVIGPGSTETDSIKEIQSILNNWGYNLQVNGNFDPATADALMRFKAANSIFDSFVFDTGEQGVLPFVDNKTREKITYFLMNNLQPNPGLDHTPGVTPPPAPPAPPAPAPAPLPTPIAPAPAPDPAPIVPITPSPGPAASGLTPEQAQIAQQAGILATPENFKAFTDASAALQAEQGVVGPGLNDSADAVSELQTLLQQWGYAVTPTGKFDQATIEAVLKFKRDNNITYGYLMADGSPAVNPYIDNRTKDFMIKKLGG